MTTFAFLGEFGDALDYIFHARESQAGGAQVGGKELLPLIWTHLEVTGIAMAMAIAVALPLGLWLGHTGRGSFLTISVSNIGRAVPSVARTLCPSSWWLMTILLFPSWSTDCRATMAFPRFESAAPMAKLSLLS